MLSFLIVTCSVFSTSVLSSPLLPAGTDPGPLAHDADRTQIRHGGLEERQTTGLHAAAVSASQPQWSPWPLESASLTQKHGPTEVIVPRQTIQPPMSSPPNEAIVPQPQATDTETFTGRAHRFGHGAIPMPKRHEHQDPIESIELCIGDCPDAPGPTLTRPTKAAPLTRSTGLDVSDSVSSIISAALSAAEDTPISIWDPTPATTTTITTTRTSTSWLPGFTASVASPAGCVTTTAGQMSNPCHTDGVMTIHTATETAFRSVDCHGCTSVHVVAPLWGCPLETLGMPSSTALTPYTWTSTVCLDSTTASEPVLTVETVPLETETTVPSVSMGGGVVPTLTASDGAVATTTSSDVTTTTQLVWPTSSTGDLPWFSVSGWHGKR